MGEESLSQEDSRAPVLPRERRIGVIGGSRIDGSAEPFCRQLGERLTRYANVIIVSGGTKGRLVQNQMQTFTPSAVWYTVDGFRHALESKGANIKDRIETRIPEERRPDYVTFEEGTIIKTREATPQARRFALVSSVDVLVSIEGDAGTEQMLDLALALKRPTLPIPNWGGASKRC